MPEDHGRDELARLVDEAACRRVLARYGPALDWRDPEALAGTIWPDAQVDYGFFQGTGDQYVALLMDIERAAQRPFHMLVCEHIAVRGRTAEAESIGIAITIETAPDGRVMARQYWGRYLDQLQKRGEEWRIQRRTYLAHGVFDVATPDPGSFNLGGINMASDLQPGQPLHRRF